MKNEIAQLGSITQAMAQAVMSTAIKKARKRGVRPHIVLDCHASRVRGMLEGHHLLTVEQLGQVLGACGYEVRFKLVKA